MLTTPSEGGQLEKKTDKKYKTDMLTKFDPFFQAQAGQILDLRTQDEKRATIVQNSGLKCGIGRD